MRKHKVRIINIIILVIIVGGSLAVRYLPGWVPYWQCSEVYKRYKDVEGVRATYIKDYRVNDTLTVGVTLLEATTDSGWAVLQEDFGLPTIPKDYETLLCGDSNRVSVKGFPKPAPLYISGDTIEDDIIAISRYKRIIAYFDIQGNGQLESILVEHCGEKIKVNTF